MITVTMIHKANLVIKSKETAREFYKGVKSCILIPYTEDMVIRVEPGNLIGFVSKEDVRNGNATFVPNFSDYSCDIAYRYRKYINAYLRKDDE